MILSKQVKKSMGQEDEVLLTFSLVLFVSKPKFPLQEPGVRPTRIIAF